MDISAPWFVTGVGYHVPTRGDDAEDVVDALYAEWRLWARRLAAYADMPVEARRGKRYFAMYMRGVEVMRLTLRVRRGRVIVSPCDMQFIVALYSLIPERAAIAYILR